MKSFRWNRTPDKDGPLSDVNMTPLIDVSLVLVVILLLTTPLVFESSFGISRTQVVETETETETEASDEPTVSRVSLAILSDTEVQVNDVVVSVKALPATIAPLIAVAVSKEVAVRCADLVSHGTFVQVLDITKLSGATGIAVAGN